jgi:hypothetical protein
MQLEETYMLAGLKRNALISLPMSDVKMILKIGNAVIYTLRVRKALHKSAGSPSVRD